MKRVLRVLADEAGHTLAELIGDRLNLEANLTRRTIDSGAVYLDGRRCWESDQRVKAGQKVLVHSVSEEHVSGSEPQIRVAFVDEHVAVLDKPAGMPSIPTRRGGVLSVDQWTRQRWGVDARLLHRLDRMTSGLLLISRCKATRKALVSQVSKRTLERRYLVVVRGVVTVSDLLIEAPLTKHRAKSLVGHSSNAQEAATVVRLLGSSGGRTLLQATLRTGRMHQIRAHLAHLGLPVVGDERYGGPRSTRLALHAHCLAFARPDGRRLEVHSPLPAEMRAMLWCAGAGRAPDKE